METKKYTINNKAFIEWWFSSPEDFEVISEGVFSELLEKGKSKLTSQDLFNDCGYIPIWLTNEHKDEDDAIELYPNVDVLLVNN